MEEGPVGPEVGETTLTIPQRAYGERTDETSGSTRPTESGG